MNLQDERRRWRCCLVRMRIAGGQSVGLSGKIGGCVRDLRKIKAERKI